MMSKLTHRSPNTPVGLIEILTREPSLTHSYSDGHSTPYSGDRSLADLSRFIDEQSSTYARALLPNAPSQAQEVVASGFHRPNPEGQVAEVDEVELERLIAEGPVLADFYAPWCGQ